MITITELDRTCYACPSSWRGKTSTGEAVSIRYRWGYLAVGVGATHEEAIANRMQGKVFFEHESKDEYAGFMSDQKLKDLLSERACFRSGVIENPCQQNHDDMGCVNCQVCGADPTEKSIENYHRYIKENHPALYKLMEEQKTKRVH